MVDFPRWPVSYYIGSEHIWQDEEQPPPLRIGDGVILEGGSRRVRVIDIWHSYDKHGAFGWGTNVFVEDVTDGDDDYPQRLAPRYFTPST